MPQVIPLGKCRITGRLQLDVIQTEFKTTKPLGLGIRMVADEHDRQDMIPGGKINLADLNDGI